MWTIDTYQVDTTKHLLICPDKKIENYLRKNFWFYKSYTPIKNR